MGRLQLCRVFDETLLLPHCAGGDAVIGTSTAFVALGALFAAFLLFRRRHRAEPAGGLGDPWAAPGLGRGESTDLEGW